MLSRKVPIGGGFRSARRLSIAREAPRGVSCRPFPRHPRAILAQMRARIITSPYIFNYILRYRYRDITSYGVSRARNYIQYLITPRHTIAARYVYQIAARGFISCKYRIALYRGDIDLHSFN